MTGPTGGGQIDAQAKQYKDQSPPALLKQLNENWTELRLVKRAIADRDRVIDELHSSIAQRDKAIKQLSSRLRFAKVRIVLLYSLIGGVAAKGAEELILALIKFFAAFWGHH
jgi:hypothetical protein